MPAIGDLLYPDNPDRRARAAELAGDIKSFGIEFDKLMKNRDITAARLKPKLQKLSQQHDLEDPTKLKSKIDDKLNSEELRKYHDLKERITKVDEFESVIMDVINFFAATVGTVAGIGVSFGVAGAASLASGVGEVVAILAALVALASVIEASSERDKLRASIVSLIEQRIQVRICLGQMEVITQYIGQVEIWLDNLGDTHQDVMNNLVSQTIAEEYKRWDQYHAEKILTLMDDARNSWRKEDDWNKFGVLLRGTPSVSPFGS